MSYRFCSSSALALGVSILKKKLVDDVQQRLMLAIAGVLVIIGVIFLIPMVNDAVNGLFWFFLKVFTIIYTLIWFRGTFPRLRYYQLMNFGWKILIPLGIVAILVNAAVGVM